MKERALPLTPAQLIAALLCAGTFSLMTSPAPGGNAVTAAIGAVWSGALQTVLLLPLILLAERFPGQSPCSLAFVSGRRRGSAAALLYLSFFLFQSFLTVGSFTYFLDYYYTGDVPRTVTALCLTAAAVYGARLSPGALGRTAQYVLGAAALLLLLMALGARDRLDPLNLYLPAGDASEGVLSAMKTDLARNDGIAILALLLGLTREKPARTAGVYLLAATALGTLCILFMALVLGDMMFQAEQPFYALSSLSGSGLMERNDALFMLTCTAAGTVKLALLLHCAGRCGGYLFPTASPLVRTSVCGAISAGAALALLIPRRWEILSALERPLWPAVLLCVIVPLVQLIRYERPELSHKTDFTPQKE